MLVHCFYWVSRWGLNSIRFGCSLERKKKEKRRKEKKKGIQPIPATQPSRPNLSTRDQLSSFLFLAPPSARPVSLPTAHSSPLPFSSARSASPAALGPSAATLRAQPSSGLASSIRVARAAAPPQTARCPLPASR